MNNDKNVIKQVNPKTILSIFTFLVIMMVSGLIFTTYKYYDLKQNFDERSEAVTKIALIKNTNDLEAKFVELEKREFVPFTTPTELGNLSFVHPKNWHIYIKNEDINRYEVYFHPRRIRPIAKDTRYALRINVTNRSYDRVVKSFESLVRKKELTSSVVDVNGTNGTLFRGRFNKYIKGSAIIFKLRDKTIIIQTDAEQFEKDFNEIIKTIDFNV